MPTTATPKYRTLRSSRWTIALALVAGCATVNPVGTEHREDVVRTRQASRIEQDAELRVTWETGQGPSTGIRVSGGDTCVTQDVRYVRRKAVEVRETENMGWHVGFGSVLAIAGAGLYGSSRTASDDHPFGSDGYRAAYSDKQLYAGFGIGVGAIGVLSLAFAAIQGLRAVDSERTMWQGEVPGRDVPIPCHLHALVGTRVHVDYLATAGKQGIAIVATDRDGRTAVPYAALEAAYAGDFSNRNPQVMVSVGNASASLKLTDDQLEAFAAARHKRVQAATATLAKEIKVRLQKRDFDAARELAGRCIALGLDRDACGKLQTSVTNAVQANEERLERIEERRERQEEAQADRDAGAEAPMGTAKAGPASSPSNVHQAAAGGTQAQEMPSKLAGSVLGQLVKAADSCETLKATTRAWAKAQAPADMKADDLMTMVWALTAMSPDQIKPQYRKLSDMNIVKRNRAGRVQFDNAVKSALIQTVYLPAECRKQISETAINLLARCKAVASAPTGWIRRSAPVCGIR